MNRISRLFPLLLLLATASAAAGQEASLERVVVIGASASAGFGVQDDAERSQTLASVLDRMIRSEHAPPVDLASSLFFLDPPKHARRQVEAALERDPSLVVAVDFLFWMVYGSEVQGLQRLVRLEEGLSLLDRFSCPLVLAEIPDMRAAIGHMLRARQVPEPRILALANGRIRAWAAARPERVLVPLPAILHQAGEGSSPPAAFLQLPGPETGPWLQEDHLHPNLRGLVLLGGLILDRCASTLPGLEPEGMILDLEVVEMAVREGWTRGEVLELAR